jgi:superfamily II DNA or RNA helicase
MILRDYQVDLSKKAVNILKEKKIVYLMMEPRCGKTLTALETAKLYGANNVLFLTKKKAISSIESDTLTLGIRLI